MRPLVVLGALSVLLGACAEQPAIPPADLGIFVTTDARSVAFGAPLSQLSWV